MNVVLRSATDPAGLAATVGRKSANWIPTCRCTRFRTMSHRVDESLARRRFAMLLLTLFAGLALGLAAVGIV